MGDLDIGIAMVAARIGSSKPGKEPEHRGKKENRGSFPDPGRRPADKKPSFPGVKMEVVNGNLTLVPSIEPSRNRRSRGWTLMREDGSVVPLDAGEVAKPEKSKNTKGLR